MVSKLFCLQAGMVTLVTPVRLQKKPYIICSWGFFSIMKIMN